MNDRNREIFFNEESEVTAVVTVTAEDGTETEAEIIACVEIEELNKEFVALLPANLDEDADEAEALILEYTEDANGEPVFSAIEDDELFETVAEAFNEFFEQAAEEEDDETEDDDEDEERDYLDDIGDILPGVSIKNE